MQTDGPAVMFVHGGDGPSSEIMRDLVHAESLGTACMAMSRFMEHSSDVETDSLDLWRSYASYWKAGCKDAHGSNDLDMLEALFSALVSELEALHMMVNQDDAREESTNVANHLTAVRRVHQEVRDGNVRKAPFTLFAKMHSDATAMLDLMLKFMQLRADSSEGFHDVLEICGTLVKSMGSTMLVHNNERRTFELSNTVLMNQLQTQHSVLLCKLTESKRNETSLAKENKELKQRLEVEETKQKQQAQRIEELEALFLDMALLTERAKKSRTSADA